MARALNARSFASFLICLFLLTVYLPADSLADACPEEGSACTNEDEVFACDHYDPSLPDDCGRAVMCLCGKWWDLNKTCWAEGCGGERFMRYHLEVEYRKVPVVAGCLAYMERYLSSHNYFKTYSKCAQCPCTELTPRIEQCEQFGGFREVVYTFRSETDPPDTPILTSSVTTECYDCFWKYSCPAPYRTQTQSQQASNLRQQSQQQQQQQQQRRTEVPTACGDTLEGQLPVPATGYIPFEIFRGGTGIQLRNVVRGDQVCGTVTEDFTAP